MFWTSRTWIYDVYFHISVRIFEGYVLPKGSMFFYHLDGPTYIHISSTYEMNILFLVQFTDSIKVWGTFSLNSSQSLNIELAYIGLPSQSKRFLCYLTCSTLLTCSGLLQVLFLVSLIPSFAVLTKCRSF